MRSVVLLMICLCAAYVSFAQGVLKGNVMEVRTDVMLVGIKVENLTNHTETRTQSRGIFSIKAKAGDLLLFSGLNYQPDTVYLINLKHLTVLLELRNNQLADVKINTARPNSNYYNPTAEKGLLGSHTVFYKPGGGLRIKLFDSHANEKKRKLLERLELEGQQEHEIALAFSADTIKKYLPFSGVEMDNFITKYRPDIKTFYNKRFNLAAYLNDCYKDFQTYPVEKRKSATWLQLNSLGNK